MTSQRFVFITEILKVFTKKKEECCVKKFSSGVPQVGVRRNRLRRVSTTEDGRSNASLD